MLFSKYSPLHQNDLNSEELGSEDKIGRAGNMRQNPLVHATRVNLLLVALLIVSVLLNGLGYDKLRRMRARLDTQSYVGLQRDVSTTIGHDASSIDDPEWDNPKYDHQTGFITLDAAFVEAKGLPSAMRWPWDSSRGIYILHGFHSLHCVFAVRQSLAEFRDNQSQTFSPAHIDHCLTVLREDILCSADDTPRYTGHLHAEANKTVATSGVGQIRMCRDWNRLRDFALQHSACYRRPADHFVPILDRYKNCPDGSKPWETMS